MRVLVTAASKHGSTWGIAEHIAKALTDHDLEVELIEPDEVDNLDGFEAIVIGSAVYAGNWRNEAKAFVDGFASTLRARKVWLFSSGPLGDDDEPGELRDLDDYMKTGGAISHTWFAGKVDREDLNVAERAIVKVVGAPYGDFRHWDEIADWASDVADQLRA